MSPVGASCGDLAGTLRLLQVSTIIFVPKCHSKILRCPHDHRAVPVRGLCNVTPMCLQATGLLFFGSNWSLCDVKQNSRGHDALNPYDGHKVSLRRLHRNGDFDIVRASYTRRKANVAEASSDQLARKVYHFNLYLYFCTACTVNIP